MRNGWQLQRLKRGTAGWNRWREKHLDARPDLPGADLSGANLSNVNLSNAHLSNASLVGADLKDAVLDGAILISTDLSKASLIGASLIGANLHEANLSEADLSEVDLSGAQLSNAILSSSTLSNANLSRTIFYQTVCANIDFRAAKGLTEINHQGPSPIHLPTLRLPQDGSALHFLRGVGLTDEYIDTWRSLMMHPIQYYSVFILYTHKDELLASRLHADLQAHGVRCWFAPEDLKIGNKLRDHIDKAIHLQDKLLLLLSAHSLASGWVENEVEAALEKEARQQREVLFPIRLDDAVMQTSKAWAATLRRTRHIGNFTSWIDPLAYQGAFDRLLRDLKEDANV